MSSFSTSDSSDASPTSDCSTSASDCPTSASASSLLLVSDRPSPALEINEVSVGVGLFIPTSRCEAGAVVGQACFSDFRSLIDKGEAEECHLKEKMSRAGDRLSKGGECVSGFDKKDVEGDRLGEPEHGGFFVADNCQGGGGLVGERGESSTLAEGCQAAVRNFEVGGSVADKRQVGERERCDTERFMEDEEYLMVWPRTEKVDGCQLRGKACGAEEEVVAEGSRSLSLVENLTKSLGLGSSTDSEEEEMRDEDLGADICLAMVAEERQPIAIEELGVNDESEGLTEEAGVVRRETLDPGMLDDEWRQKTLALNGEDLANSIYHIPKGYSLHLPPKGSFIHDPPEGYVGVYLKHLEFGLRFPLVDEIVQIVSRMGLSLGQLTPQSVRVIVAYVWVCRFFRVPPTVDLFRSLHHIAPVSNGAGYWMVVSEPGKLVVWPKKSSTKDWRGRFFFLSYPEGEWPVLRTPGLRPLRRLETDEELLSSRPLAAKRVELKLKKERRAYKHFDFSGGLPSKWLPPAEVIFNDRYLHSLGLIPALSGGGVDWSEEECDKIGLYPDLTAKLPNPRFREADRKMSIRDVAKSLSKATKKMVLVVKSYPGPKRPLAVIPEPSRAVARSPLDRPVPDRQGQVERGRSEKRRSSPPRGGVEKRRRSLGPGLPSPNDSLSQLPLDVNYDLNSSKFFKGVSSGTGGKRSSPTKGITSPGPRPLLPCSSLEGRRVGPGTLSKAKRNYEVLAELVDWATEMDQEAMRVGKIQNENAELRRARDAAVVEATKEKIDALVKEKMRPLVKENDKKWAARLEKKEQTLLNDLEAIKKKADEAETARLLLAAQLVDAGKVFLEELQAKYMEGWSDGNAFTRESVGEFCPTFDWARQDGSPPVDAPDQALLSSPIPQAVGDSPIDIEAP